MSHNPRRRRRPIDEEHGQDTGFDAVHGAADVKEWFQQRLGQANQ